VRSAQFGGRTYLQSALLSSERHVQTLDSGRISRIPRYNVACTPLTHTQRHPSLGEVDFFWGGTHLGRVKNKRTKPALEMAAPAVARAPRQDPVGAYADLRAVAELRGTCRYSAIAWAPRCWPEPRLFECGKLKKWGGCSHKSNYLVLADQIGRVASVNSQEICKTRENSFSLFLHRSFFSASYTHFDFVFVPKFPNGQDRPRLSLHAGAQERAKEASFFFIFIS
jgi:hypothetical protein